jgi:hypothetical protein
MSVQTEEARRLQGGCLCGAVRYEAAGRFRPVIVCHCGMCQRTHGAPASYTAVDRPALKMTEDRGLRWYRSSDEARRGFCNECGASLFFDWLAAPHISIAAGTLDGPTGLRTVAHIYAADKGDYYEIVDGLTVYPGDDQPS